MKVRDENNENVLRISEYKIAKKNSIELNLDLCRFPFALKSQAKFYDSTLNITFN